MNLSDTTIKWRWDTLFPPDKGANGSIDKNVQIQPSTVDLRLGNVFFVPKDQSEYPSAYGVDPRTAKAEDYYERMEVEDGKSLLMYPGPGGFILGQTMEYVSIPHDLVGFVDGRSSYGRWGLRIHSTAGLIDAGFQGIITLEISLDGRHRMQLTPGERICQIRFEMLDMPTNRPYGHESRRSKYQNQTGVTPSLSNKDGETTDER